MKMKRMIMSLMAATALCGAAQAQTLRVADVEALPGETVSFALTIDVEGGAYSGFQFQMQFPTEGFTLVDATASTAWAGGSLGVGDLDASGEANGSGISLSDTAIPDGEQEIGTVRFTVADGTAVGDYPVTISGFNFLDGTNYTPVDDVTFTVHVVSVHSVVLDETSTTAPVASNGAVNVRVKRTVKAGEWSTLCLPFAMTEAQVAEAFGSDVQIGDFNGYTFDDEAGTITVSFTTATAIEANHPYIIKVGQAVSEFAVDGVSIDPEEEPTVNKGTSRKPKAIVGTYAAGTVIENGCLFLSAGQFWYSTGKTKMKAFRAYFDFFDLLPDFEDNYAESRIGMSFGDATAIGDASRLNDSGETINDKVYELQGRHVYNSDFTVQKTQLTKGLYIKGGKKTVNK